MPSEWLVTFRGERVPFSPRLLKPAAAASNRHLPEFWLGYDSEAATMADGFPEVQTMQTYDGQNERLEYVKTGDSFRHFWSIVIRSIPERYLRGVRSGLVTVPVYCHNWEYDWGMIVKTAPPAWQLQAKLNSYYEGFVDTTIVERSKWQLKVEQGHMSGNAPLLTVVARRKRFAVRLMLLDTFPFFPRALASAAKDLGLEKGDRASVIGVDWRTVDYHTEIDAVNEQGEKVKVTKKQFETYAKHDPAIVWHLGGRIRKLHEVEGLTSLAVSGAGYAAKVMLHRLRVPYASGYGGIPAVQIALDAFHGGRSGRLVHGRVEGVSIYDFRSSYPSIQIGLPALHQASTLCYKLKDLDIAEFMHLAKKYHGYARVSGVERDSHYPALLSANPQGVIRPVVGEFARVPATAAEVYCGVVFGGLTLTHIDEAIFYAPREGHDKDRPFADFINRAWERKNSFPKGSIEYDAAKIQANSGYGKLIEHRSSRGMVTDWIQIPLFHKGEEGVARARNFFMQYHPDYWHEARLDWMKQTGQSIGTIWLHELMNAAPEFGFYACPQYAAWITGHAHARLVLLMRATDAVKWDTDSVTTALTETEVRRRLDNFPKDRLPVYLQPLSIGNDLGELDMEARDMSGVILGNKRYYLEGQIKKGAGWTLGVKEGHHGLPGIHQSDIRRVLLEGAPDYTPKARPVKTRGAESWEEVGLFRVGSRKHSTYSPKFVPGENQDWSAGGAYRPFAGFPIE